METMTITVTTEIKLPQNPENWQVENLEEQILSASMEGGRQAYSEALKEHEKHMIKGHPEWDRKERPIKKIATRLGTFRYERYRVWDKKLMKSRYPLDEALGMKKHERVSRDYKKILVEQAVQRSYRQSAREMKNQTTVNKSVMSNWRVVQDVAFEERQEDKKNKILDWKRMLLPDPPRPGEEDPCPVLGIDVDDTYCRSWKTKKLLKDHQVRTTVLYRHKERVSRKRWKLKDKTVVASGPGEKLEDYYNRVVQVAVTHYGLHEKTHVVVHGDGDPQIRNFANQYFTNSLYRLDPWHVNKKIKEALGITRIPDGWYEDIYGKPDQLIAKIKTFNLQIAKSDPSKEKIDALVQYLENNREGMLPSGVSKETKQKYPRLYKRGSGTIERNIGWTVNDRFKLSRMSWSQNGLENLLFLRQDYLNTEVKPTYLPKPGTKPEFFCLE